MKPSKNYAHVFTTLESAIRRALAPDNPQLLACYLLVALDELSNLPNDQARQVLMYRVLDILQSTAADKGIPYHWRQQCVDYFYKPLAVLEKLADTEQAKDRLRLHKFRIATTSICHNH